MIGEKELGLMKKNAVIINTSRGDIVDDYPPDRFYEPIHSGPFKGISLDQEKLTDIIKEHDELHGWDIETGIPTKKTLESLDLQEIAYKLWLK